MLVTSLTAGEVREQVYLELLRARAALYPSPPFGHHPNFVGSSEAAERLLEHLLAYHLAPGDTVLSYPDYVLKPLRKGLLERGVSVVVPAKYGQGYRLLESGKVNPARASSISGAEKEGVLLTKPLEARLCLVACVALCPKGTWLGKGYGFRLPAEMAPLSAFALAHPLMVLNDLPEADGWLSAFATPEEVVETEK